MAFGNERNNLESKASALGTMPKLKLWTPLSQSINFFANTHSKKSPEPTKLGMVGF
jgi:hypothetical protein